MAARIAMIATTIISSISVKPFWIFMGESPRWIEVRCTYRTAPRPWLTDLVRVDCVALTVPAVQLRHRPEYRRFHQRKTSGIRAKVLTTSQSRQLVTQHVTN